MDQRKCSRRELLSSLGLVSGLGYLLDACKHKPIQRGTIQSQNPIDENTRINLNQYSYNRLEQLKEIQTTIKAGRNDLSTQVLFYGSLKRAMLVINLPNYHVGALEKISVFRKNGDPICEKMITEADISPLNTLYPLSFENLALHELSSLYILYTLSDDSEPCLAVTDKVAFHNRYKNKPVMEAIAADARPFANFGIEDTKNLNCRSDGSRGFSLQCDENVTIVAANGLSGFEVCDLMSNPIVLDGGNFTQILQYPNVICYKLDEANNRYIRSFLRLF